MLALALLASALARACCTPAPPPSWRVKGSNCAGGINTCHANTACECEAVTVMSAASKLDIPHLRDVPGLNVRSFRIPAIVGTPDGVLVAFAEARQGAYGRGVCKDHEGHDLPQCPPGEHPSLEPTDDMGPKTIAFKRSTDGGSTWSSLGFVPGLYQPGWVVGNPAVVYDDRTHTIVLHVLNSTLMPAPLNDSMTNTGFTLQVTSSDAGRTWSHPVQLNQFLQELRGIAPGPGNAIQLKHGKVAGRLLMPGWSSICYDTESCVNGSQMGELTFAAVYYSDDGAKTWKVGPGAAVPRNLHGPVAEPTLAELSNGSVTLNMRNICSPANGGELRNASICADVGMMAARMSSRSDDGGLTFGPASFVPGLPSPNDQGSMISSNEQHPPRNALYFSGPYSKTSRGNISIVASFDDGASWPVQTVVYPQAAKYSCLATLNDSLALLVERHNGLYSEFDITFFAIKAPAFSDAKSTLAVQGDAVVATCVNASDCTEELQAAFSSGAAHVHVPKLEGGRAWIVRPLKLRSNQIITLAAGVEIVAKRLAFQSKYIGLLSADAVKNVTIEGGVGSMLRMHRADYANASADQGIVYAKSEWRHGINLVGSQDIIIRGIRITETGGDGVQIASCEKGDCVGQATSSSNILIENCESPTICCTTIS